MAGQIDVYPSIMGLLELPFENNTLGINLFKEKRPYIYFNVDDKYAVLDNEWLMIVKKDGTKGLYKYREKDQNNYLVENKELGERMRIYAESNIQTYQYLLSNNKTKIKSKKIFFLNITITFIKQYVLIKLNFLIINCWGYI